MKYKNAQDILPDRLLKELQTYISGEVLYIPVAGSKKQWGESSGARSYYKARNEEIRRKYAEGAKPEQLAEEYNLSIDSIYKII